jgi:DNA-binding NtrC family response regulator
MVPSSDLPFGGTAVAPRGRILFVEDELLIRLVVSDELRDAGYDVVECYNADEAIILLEAGVKFDLIVSDVRMPGNVDGLGLLTFIRETRPKLPVILTSGHLGPTLALREGATRFLPKPFGLDAVVSAVRAELGRVQ